MYLIYQFFISYRDPSTHEYLTNVWLVSGTFTLLEDAEAQMGRFIESGADPEYLQIVVDTEPAPTDIPTH